MKLEDLTNFDHLVDLLSGTQAVAFSIISDNDACHRWIQGELVKFRYLKLSRQGKGCDHLDGPATELAIGWL